MSRPRACALLLSSLVAACGADRSRPPDRTSPELEVIDDAAAPISMIVDRMRTEPTWLDPTTMRVLRLRDGVVEPVLPDVAVPEDASALRVFDDGTVAIATPERLHLYDASGVGSVLEVAFEAAFDGTSIHDLWIAEWPPLEGSELCHHTPGGAECVGVPNVGAYPPHVALAADGSVYVTDRDVGLHRLADGVLAPVATLGDGGLVSFRRSGDALFALAYDGTLFVVEGDRLEARGMRFLRGVVGSADDHYELRVDREETQVDPSCRNSFLRPCERRLLWSEHVVVRVRGGAEEEIAHETCDDARPEACARAAFELGLDGDRVVVMGAPFRWLP